MGETEFPHELPSARENLSQLPAMPIRGLLLAAEEGTPFSTLNHISGDFQLPE